MGIKQQIGTLLAQNGCDCDCDHDSESHDDSCDRCLACRIDDVLVEHGARRRRVEQVDRCSFIAWTQGVLFDRDRDGRVIIGDNVRHERAMRALQSGETIALTEGGRVVSTMRLAPEVGAYVEEEV